MTNVVNSTNTLITGAYDYYLWTLSFAGEDIPKSKKNI